MRRSDFIILIGALLSPIKVLPIKKKTLLQDWNSLTLEQEAIRDFAYNYGRRFGFEKTLTAIAWQESSFGLPSKLQNPVEPSGGVFGGNYTTVARRHFNLGSERVYIPQDNARYTIKYQVPTKAQKYYVQKRLKTDTEFAAEHAVLQIEEGVKNSPMASLLGVDWWFVWAYYNGGTNCLKEPYAHRYAEDIKKKVNIITKVGYNGS